MREDVGVAMAAEGRVWEALVVVAREEVGVAMAVEETEGKA